MGLKYFCEYRTLNTDELWKVEIYIPSYSGEPIRKIGAAGQTCIVDWSGGDKLLDKFAIGSSASITLLFDDATEVTELQNINDKTVVVKVYNNGGTDLYWQGYLISDGVQHPDSGVIFPITLTAVDMIEAANEITFANTDVGAVTIGGVVGSEKSPLNWIRKCLAFADNMGNDMPIRWSCSVKNSQYPTDDFFGGRTSFIYNYEEFLASRQETFVGWMLENIAKSVGCLLFQNGGYWYIVSLKDLAISSTLTFNQITAGLGAKTATTTSINLSKVLPTKLNESTYTMAQKPISKVKSTYNHSMQTNIIPNGGFDIVESGKPLYWEASLEDIDITSVSPINGRKTGFAVNFNNSGSDVGFATFEVGGLNTMPLDANILFKNIQWGFTFMPINWPVTGEEGFISWSGYPLEIIVSYTGYNGGNLQRFYLNEFGYWTGRSLVDGSLKITNVDTFSTSAEIDFDGDAYIGQAFRMTYRLGVVPYAFDVFFDEDMTTFDALTKIALETDGFFDGFNTISYSFPSTVTRFSATMVDPIEQQPKIDFIVDGLKNLDVATVQFQSKGNQGNVLMPNPGVLDQMRALESGKLELLLLIKPEREIVFDDLYMNVSSDKEYWDITDGGNDGKEEYDLDISSSFSGFMNSSYMDNFATSDLSMIMGNGVDTGTLTEIFGKTALRILSSPTKKIDTELEGAISLLNILQYSGGKYLPLKSSVNTETNESKLTIFELNYNDELVLTSVHKSTGDGDNSGSGIGGSGTGGGGGGSGATSLAMLTDVALAGLVNNQVLTYNSETDKWENKAGGLIGKKVQIYLDKGISTQGFLTIPSAVSTDPLTDDKWQIYVDEDGEGSGGSPLVINLTDLGDVTITSPTNGQALIYNSTTGKWVNGAGGGDSSSIATLTDVTLTSLADKQLLQYDSASSKWKNVNGQGFAFGDFVGRISGGGISFNSGVTVSIYTNSNKDLILSANSSFSTETGGVILQTHSIDRLIVDVDGNIKIPILNTGGTAPTTSGTLNMVVVDANGKLSRQTIPTVGSLSTLSDVTLTSLSDKQLIQWDSSSSKFINTSTIVLQNIKATNKIEIPEKSSGTPTGNVWEIYVAV